MRALLFTTGSPYARAIRIILHELGLEYERREEVTTPSAELRAKSTPTLQVPTFWDGDHVLWESGIIAEYLLETYTRRESAKPPLSASAWRSGSLWQDKLLFSTIQTFGNAATTISQMTWTGIPVDHNAHLQRSALKLTHILGWLEEQLVDSDAGFFAESVSMQDIFLASHIRFVQARPLGIELNLSSFANISRLLDGLDERQSFVAEPIWWWEPGIIGYQADGTPIHQAKV